jgi:hypothetical protein
MLRVAQLEDDCMQAEWTWELLTAAFANLHFTHFSSSREFLSALPRLAESGLDLVIADVLMMWSHSEDRPDWEFQRGGLHLVEAMRSTPDLENVPVVFWTVYSPDQIDSSKRLRLQ